MTFPAFLVDLLRPRFYRTDGWREGERVRDPTDFAIRWSGRGLVGDEAPRFTPAWATTMPGDRDFRGEHGARHPSLSAQGLPPDFGTWPMTVPHSPRLMSRGVLRRRARAGGARNDPRCAQGPGRETDRPVAILTRRPAVAGEEEDRVRTGICFTRRAARPRPAVLPGRGGRTAAPDGR